MVMTFLSESMLALKSILEPLEFVALRVIKVSRSELEIAESSVFCIAVLNLRTIFELTATPEAEFAGTNSETEGARVVAIDPLPVVVSPLTVIAKQLVYHVPEEVISKSLHMKL